MRKLLMITFALAASSWAADITGTWTGAMEMKRGGETRPEKAHLVLTQTGNDVKGTVGPSAEKQLPISKGTIAGSDIVIEATIPDKDARIILRLKVDGEKLAGTLGTEGPEAEEMSGTMTLSRVR